MLSKVHSYFALIIILAFGYLFQHRYVNEFPSHIHACAQADRYALAIQFSRTGLNFFAPSTFLMTSQFSEDWEKASDNNRTAVDFPLHDYLPAVFMKLLGSESPIVFRLYILFYSFFGLLFLFRLLLLLTNDFYKSLFVLIFAATSPVFVYYQGVFFAYYSFLVQ